MRSIILDFVIALVVVYYVYVILGVFICLIQ